ncbi:Uncharacterised protein [Shigella sonnei]|nr:Uncharacterised protein [Shigella sonnei]CSG07003.1 Uncharacterised protein [Shigella sonnei]CSG15881.1 Uncharacterised protein [Shigella sonnei]CSG22231.1 Uncharacterised protein [Shigella sonnei]CSG25065.1 Uncharacterised protein [Shigella sonnei]
MQRIAGCGDIIGMIIRFFAATHNNVAIRVAAGLIDGHLTIFVWREEHMAGAGCADSIHSNPRIAIGTIFKTYRTGECRSHFTVDLTFGSTCANRAPTD